MRLVTQAYINRTFAAFGERVYGCYSASNNIIYLDKSQTPEQLLHTFLHEISHMLDYQLKPFNIEQKADAYATWALSFYKIDSVQRLLGT